jgi:hypothetical protein
VHSVIVFIQHPPKNMEDNTITPVMHPICCVKKQYLLKSSAIYRYIDCPEKEKVAGDNAGKGIHDSKEPFFPNRRRAIDYG